MNRILRSLLPPNLKDLAVFDTTTGSSLGRTRGSSLFQRGLFLFSFICLALFSNLEIYAQGSTYNVVTSSSTYTPITGGTVLFSGATVDDNTSTLQTINSFTFNGAAVTKFSASANGWIAIGGTAATTSTGYTPLSGAITATGAVGVISPMGRDLGAANASAEVRWEYLDGSNETVVQWSNMQRYFLAGENLNFQLRLNHTTNEIVFSYGTITAGSSATYFQVGLKTILGAGVVGSSLNSLTVANTPTGTTCNWTNAVSSRLATSTMLLNSTIPNISCPSGTTFTFTPQGGASATWVNHVATYAPATAITENQGTISWTAPTNANAYNVQYRAVGSCAWTNFPGNPVAATTATLTGLSPLTSYQVRVQSLNSTSGNTCRFSHLGLGNSTSNSDGYTLTGYFTTLNVQCSGAPAAPVATLTGSASICAGATKGMTATNFGNDLGLSTQWLVSTTSGGPYSPVVGGTGATTGSYTTAAMTAGTYYFVCARTCANSTITTNSNELVLTVNALPTVVLTATNGGAFCGAQTLTASGASTYAWTPANTLGSATGETVLFTGSSSVTVNVSGTDANGCVGTASQAVTYTAPTEITVAATVPTFCGVGGTSTLTATSSAPYVYTWSVNETGTLSTTSGASTDFTIAQTSSARVIGTDATTGCSAIANYSVGVYPLPSATVTTTASGVCPGTAATINSGLSAGNFTVSSIPHVSFVAPASAGVIMNNGVAVTPLGGGTMDDGGWGGIPIGFNFNFFGNSFTTLGAGTNGVLMFGTIPGFGILDGQLGDYTFTGPPYFPNAANAGNVIALLASDMQMANSVNGSIKYWTEGYSPNRRFVIKYDRVHGWSNNPEATVTCVLYETLGMVDIYVTNKTFGNTAIIGLQDATKTIGAVAPGRAGGTWTVTTPEGWRFSPPANYLTVWSATDVNGTTGLTTNVDGSTINTINGFSATVAPLLTTTYAISYANATTGCSNSASPAQVTMAVLSNVAPQGVSATSTVTTACPGANIPLATSYTGILDGLTFQWQVSTDGGANWADIAGATSATYTATQAVASSFRVGIASCGGAVTYTSPVAIALTGFIDCYCSTSFFSTADEEITNVTVATLNNSSTCATVAPGPGSALNTYSNYTSGAGAPAAPALVQDASVSGAVTIGSCGTFNYTSGAAIFIDYNQNGLFTDAGEMVWNNGTLSNINCVPATTLTFSFTVPATATPGLTRMRVVNAENIAGSAMNPCGAYGYGETEDYLVQILGPCAPGTFFPPLAVAAEPDGTVCGTQTSQMQVFDLNGIVNPIYMWYDAPVGGNLLLNSTSNFFSPGVISATTTWYVSTNTGTCITDRFPATLNWVSAPAIVMTNSNPSSCGTTSIATNLAASSASTSTLPTFTVTAPGTSSVVTTATGLVMTGSNGGSNTAVTTLATFVAPATATYTFNWSYSTADDAPQYDPAYYINGVAVPLSAGFGANTQSGTQSVSVTAGSTFGFQITSQDDLFGAATLTITNLSDGNPGYSYSWNASPVAGSGLTAGTTGASVTGVTPTVNGVYTYTVTGTNASTGCVNTATTTVGFYSPLTGTATVTQPLVCGANGSVNFGINGSGTVFANDFSSATLNPAQAELCNNAVITSGKLQFTGPVNSQKGGILITNTTGVATNDFQIDFDLITTAGTTPPADGFSYSYGPDVVCMPTPVGAVVDNTVVGVGAANPENGSGTGIRLSFDAYTNGVNVNGIYLMYNCPRINPSSALTPAEGLYYYANNTSWIGGANTHVTITINALGQMSMWLAGTQVLNNAALPAGYLTADKSTWKHAFAARTGLLNQGHSIDNLDIHYNNFYEYSVDNGATWTTTSPVAVPAPSTVQSLARYVTTPSCSVNLGTATVEYQVAAPTNVTGGSTCLNGTTLNVSANGAPAGGTLTATTTLGTSLTLAGSGTLSLTGAVNVPAGATISGAVLSVAGITTTGATFASDITVSMSGVSTVAQQVLSTAGVVNNVSYSYNATVPSGNGNVTVNFINNWTSAATFNSVSLIVTYTLPSDPVWFDAATGGNILGTGSTFNVVGSTYLPNASAPFSGNVYAASVVTNGASTCYSATVPAAVTVGQPLTVSVAASAPITQTFTLATAYSVAAGATQTVTGTIAIPAGATVTGTVLQVNDVTSTAGTWGNDVTIAMTGASTVANQIVSNASGQLTNAGPITYTGTNVVAPGGDVFVTITHNYSFGGPMDFGSIAVLVTYTSPVTGSVCPGTPVTLNATTTGGGSNPTFQWSLNGTPIAGATSASYVATPAAGSDSYTATVIDDCNPAGVTSPGYSQPLFSVTAGTITGPPAILVNDFTAPILGAGTWVIGGQTLGSTIQWVYGLAPVAPFITISGGTSESQTLYATGGAGTVYLTATTTTTDGCSIQANVVTVTLGNAIDTPCTARPVTVGDQGGLSFSTAAAAVDAGEVFAPATGCDVQNGWCTSSLNGTVWFSFVAPASGHVSVAAPGWDNQLAIYSATNCADYSTFTLINANDDGGPGFDAFLSDVKCLVPGTTYYIQLDGYSGVGTSTLIITDLGNSTPLLQFMPNNVSVNNAAGTCGGVATWGSPVAVDDQNCVTVTSTHNSGNTFPVGVTTVTYTATDAQGLTATASLTVTVTDNELPTITAPANITLTAALNSCTATATLGSATTADTCGVASTATNNAPAVFPIGNTTVTWTVTDIHGNVATANQIVTLVPNPANIWYVDADGDNYGVAGATVTACVQPLGYAANTTDCNDANVNVNPGEIEICGNAIDDNCSGLAEEGCTSPGENPNNATSMSTSIWPNCNAVNGTLVNATVSGSAQTICLTGEDKWHQFVATSEGVSIVVNSSAVNIVIELQTAAGVLVAQENAVAGLGGEILNHYGLTAGQVYKVGVRNYNSALGTGTYSICAKMLKRGGCDYGPGPYSLCQYFKATWAGAAGTSYTFTYTGLTGPAAGNVYTRTQNSDICVLSNVAPTLPYGSTYSVLITNTYTLNNGAGVAETIAVPGLAPCSMSTIAQPVTALRTSDRCTAGPRFRGSVVASLPWVCGTTNWRWEFTELDAQNNPVGLPIAVNRGAASNYINLGTILQLQYGKTYSVRTAPILSYTGTNYQWGTPFCLSIVGSAGMIADGSQANQQVVRTETANEVNMSLYPNPTHGTDVNINLSGVDSDNVQIRVVDAMGRQVWSNRYSVSGVLNTNITFERPLANGLYMVEAIFNGEVQTQRMMVQK